MTAGFFVELILIGVYIRSSPFFVRGGGIAFCVAVILILECLDIASRSIAVFLGESVNVRIGIKRISA